VRLLAVLLLVATGAAQAHKPSDSYLTLFTGEKVRGQWDIALRDLDLAIGLDTDGDGAITWGEVRAKHAAIAAYALARLSLKRGGSACRLLATGHLFDEHSDGGYAVLRFEAECPVSRQDLELEYSLLFDLDPTHRGLLRVDDGAGSQAAVLSPERPRLRIGGPPRPAPEQFADYLREGIWHIWIGFDHILFLVSLLLPSVFAFERKAWVAAARFREAFWDVFKVATSFTAAHSITLSLAALSVIALPSRLVESAIALSVLLAALNNLRPLVHGRRWLVAFAFGLIHGFGFASVLADLGLPREALVLALVGFNLGVEAGQIALVAAFLPLAFAARDTWAYRRLIFAGGSAAIALLAAVWLVERAFDLQLY
jgi:hypothetical protein